MRYRFNTGSCRRGLWAIGFHTADVIDCDYNMCVSIPAIISFPSLTVRFEVKCDVMYYGADCTKLCIPQDDEANGHFRCDANGNKVCHSGRCSLLTILSTHVPRKGDFFIIKLHLR